MVDSTNLTIGQLFELNQGKNATQIADGEAKVRNAAKTLGLDYNKMVAPPEQVVQAADELEQEQRFERYMKDDPVIREYASNPNNAAISLDDFEKLNKVSQNLSTLTPKLIDPNAQISNDELHDIFGKGVSKEQQQKLKKLNIYQEPPKQIKTKVPTALVQMINRDPLPKTQEQQIADLEQEVIDKYGYFAAAKWKGEVQKQLDIQKEQMKSQAIPNENEDPTRLNALRSGAASLWQTIGAINYAITGDSDMLYRFTEYKNRYQSADVKSALAQASLDAFKADGEGNSGIWAGAKSIAHQMWQNPTAGLDLGIEQLYPSVVGFGVGAKAASVLTTPMVRGVAKYAPYFMSVPNAGRVVGGAAFAGSMAQGAIGAGMADASVSYGANMAEAREKFLTRAEQIDYANAKTWGSVFYSGLGGVVMPFSLGGQLRTSIGQAVAQSGAGVMSVYGGAWAVDEKADPLEVALEAVFGGVSGTIEASVVAAGKVRNTNTALFALEQAQKNREMDSVRATGFGSILGAMVDRIKDTETVKRDPTAIQNFIKAGIQEYGIGDEVYIDGQTFNQIMRDHDIDVEDLFAVAPSLKEQLGNAEEFNSSLHIPTDEFAVAMSTLENYLPFVENVRPSPDMPTMKEAQENLQKTKDDMKQEIDTYLAEQAKFESAEEARDYVHDTVYNQLKDTKSFTNDYYRPASELVAAAYTTLGDKLGISAKEAFERYPIRITNDRGVEASYSQALKTESHAPFFKAIDDVVAGNTPNTYINMGTTPDTLKIIGLPDAKISIHSKTIEKVMAQHLGLSKGEHSNIHNLSPETLRQLPQQINDPIAVFASGDKASKDGYVVLTELKENNKVTGKDSPIVAALHVKQSKNGLELVNIASVYGKESRAAIQGWLDNSLLYWNKEKGSQFVTEERLQLPLEAQSDASLSKANIKTNDDLNASTYEQNGTRGFINFKQGVDGSTIVLTKNADFSTFTHELGHHFLEMNMQIALKPDAPAQIRQDMEAVLKWADSDIEDIAEWDFLTQDEKTEVHEKFAESFEQYLFTGKAPSLELKQVFTRFRQFMIAVYRNIEKFLGVNNRAELNSDLTGVMDRMLASDNAIKEAQAANSLEMLIGQDDAMRLGISPKDYLEMKMDHDDATEFATNQLEQKTLKDAIWYQGVRSKYLKTLQLQASRIRVSVRESVAKEVAEQPIYKAMVFLRQPLDKVNKKGQDLDTTTNTLFEAIAKLGGLDAAEIESTWGVDQAAKIKSGVGNKPLARSERSKTKGLSIEHMAERLAEEGYLSVDEHGKFDTREFEDKFHEELSGVKQYSTNADAELILYAQDMDLLQGIEEGQTTKAKLSLDWIEAKYGKDSEILKSISKGAYGLAQRGGESPDLIAEAFGFESGDAMIRELVSVPSPKQRIEELTDMRMAAEHAEFFDQQSIVEAVESAVFNDVRARVIANEMAALNNLMGRKSTLNDAAKSVAQDMINRQKIKDIRPHLRARDDARLGREADVAFRKGDTIAAARHKRNQLVQFHATKYSYDAKALVDKKLQLVKKVFGNNEKLAKNRDFDFVTAARGILGKYGLGRDSSNYEQQLEHIRTYDPTTYADLQNIGALPENTTDYRDLTLDEFNAVMSAVETLWHRSKENNLWYTENEAIDREQVRNELIEQSSGKKSIHKIEEKLVGKQGSISKLKTWGLGFGASLKRVDQVITWLDGGHSGAFRKYIVNPIQDALAKYRIAKIDMLKKVVDTFDEFGKLSNARIAAPELNGYTFDGKQALIHAILHTGNMSNKERLVLGYNWGQRLEDNSVDFSAWDSFFKRMIAEGVITKKDMDTIQKLWDIFDNYKGDAQLTHKKINGYYFEELPAMVLDTPFGEYKGGYVPALYDPVRSNDQQLRDNVTSVQLELQALNIATTGASFTKSRVDDHRAPLLFDLSKLPSALDKELRYIHLELPVRQVGRMLLNKEFNNELERVLPFGVKNIFNPWLKAIVNQTVDETGKLAGFDWSMKNLRRNTGIAIMAGNLKNAVEQITGFSQVAVAVPVKHLVKAQADFVVSVATRSKMADGIMEMSDFMRTRWDRAADEYRYAIEDVVINKNKFESVRDFTMKHAYILQTTLQKPMEVVSWYAAFNHFTEQGMNQYDAVHAADAVIREYMTDMSPEGVADIERGTPAYRIFLMFYNWFNMVWNTASTEIKLALERNNGSWVKSSPRLAYIALMMMSIPAITSELIGILFAGGIDDEDDDGIFDDLSGRLALSQVKMMSAFIPYAGNVINAGIAQTDNNVMNDRYTASPVFSMGEKGLSLIKYVNQAKDEKELNHGRVVSDILNSATLFTGIPFATLGKPSNYWLQIEQGKKDEPDNNLDAVRGTVTGKHAPAN